MTSTSSKLPHCPSLQPSTSANPMFGADMDAGGNPLFAGGETPGSSAINRQTQYSIDMEGRKDMGELAYPLSLP